MAKTNQCLYLEMQMRSLSSQLQGETQVSELNCVLLEKKSYVLISCQWRYIKYWLPWSWKFIVSQIFLRALNHWNFKKMKASRLNYTFKWLGFENTFSIWSIDPLNKQILSNKSRRLEISIMLLIVYVVLCQYCKILMVYVWVQY